MWGCIEIRKIIKKYTEVPSLYVRVYLSATLLWSASCCSLIICEGVSRVSTVALSFCSFPHYMWGCIVSLSGISVVEGVPSLYVRVYRGFCNHADRTSGSLIICEGVSEKGWKKYMKMKFPHYMWGCIGERGWKQIVVEVPSLYVRVYRALKSSVIYTDGSLIICEGVSQFAESRRAAVAFPHYMWGCIEQRT